MKTTYSQTEKAINNLEQISKENNVRFEIEEFGGSHPYKIAYLVIDSQNKIHAGKTGINFPSLHSNDKRRKVIEQAAPHFKILHSECFFEI